MTNGNVQLMFQQADLLYRQQRFEECLIIIEQLEIQSPGNRDILYLKALSLAALGRFRESCDLCSALRGQFQDNRMEQLEIWIRQRSSIPPSPPSPPMETVYTSPIEGVAQAPGASGTPGISSRPLGIPSENRYYGLSQGPFGNQSLQPETPASAVTCARISLYAAILALILGFIAFVLMPAPQPSGDGFQSAPEAWMLLIPAMSIISSIAAVAVGFFGVGKNNRINRGQAIAGIILGFLGIGLMTCCFLVMFGALLMAAAPSEL